MSAKKHASEEWSSLFDALTALRAQLFDVARKHSSSRGRDEAASTENFLHYLALRSGDLRPLQERLERAGLSSLGRAEGHVLASLDATIRVLASALGRDVELPRAEHAPSVEEGRRLLEKRTLALLGPAPEGRSVRIMVTLPADAALDDALLCALLEAGMSIVRINCAHDDAEVWARMVANVRRASKKTGRACRIEMDLGGPKLRTGASAHEIVLGRGDELILTDDGSPGMPAAFDHEARELRPARIACSLPMALAHTRPGHRVFFDDGKIGGVIEERMPHGVRIRIELAKEKSSKLGPDRGINLPDTDTGLRGFTAKDREDLAFVARHADVVGLSFAESTDDFHELDEALRLLGADDTGVLLKIETSHGFFRLPKMLLAAIERRAAGVMIARGDLAIELGYERLAEVQEEILWLCEAAHVPVVWATQVLERLSKKGLPTRAEITDAAMSERAECVMLNKGPHVVSAVTLLDGILRRMEAHQRKKSARLRPLSVSRFEGM